MGEEAFRSLEAGEPCSGGGGSVVGTGEGSMGADDYVDFVLKRYYANGVHLFTNNGYGRTECYMTSL